MAPRPEAPSATLSSSMKVAKTDAKKELMVDNVIYDFTGFRHPGGSIIKFGIGQDVTTMWREFHFRSTTAKKYLKALPHRAPTDAAETETFTRGANGGALERDFDALRSELTSEGFFEPDPVHVVWRLVEIFGMHALGIWLVFSAAAATLVPALPHLDVRIRRGVAM